MLISISLANLCFLSSWLVLLNPQHYAYYYWKADPGYIESISLVVVVMALAAVFWLGAGLLLKWRNPVSITVVRVTFLTLLIWPLNSFLIDYLRTPILGLLLHKRALLIVVALVAIALFVVVLRKLEKVVSAAQVVLIVLSPLLLVNLTAAVWLRLKHAPLTQISSGIKQARFNSGAGSRVVWIIFDELQSQAVFVDRDPRVHLPEFDRLTSQAINFSAAYPPASQTLTSIPSMTTGTFFKDAVPISTNELELKSEDGNSRHWSRETTIFSDAKQMGLRTGVVGWYHPYCRVLTNDLDSCFWSPHVGQPNPSPDRLSLKRALVNNVITAVFRIPLAYRVLRSVETQLQRADHLTVFTEIKSASLELLRQRTNLTFLHFPIPHGPWIGSSSNNQIGPTDKAGYFDNVLLADNTLGELRRVLEETGEWDKSIVIVSSDHWWRWTPITTGKRDHRIPFIVKLADQQVGMEHKTPFNTVLTRQLVLEMLRGNLSRPSEVIEWIDRNSRLGESPLTVNEP